MTDKKLTIDELAQKIVREEVYCNASLLISSLAKLEGSLDHAAAQDADLDFDEIRDVCVQDDWEEPAEEHIRQMDREGLISAMEYTDADTEDADKLSDDELRTKLKEHLGEEDKWQEFCDFERIDSYTIEAYEHWVISDWFAAHLKEHGEMTGEVMNLTIWGRPTTGQAIYMDGVVQAIAKELSERN
jgi:hypothetical protein